MTTKNKSKPPPDDPKQSVRFIETAKALDVGSSGESFARAFKKIVPKRKVRKARRKP
jgi:hypothetical protein